MRGIGRDVWSISVSPAIEGVRKQEQWARRCRGLDWGMQDLNLLMIAVRRKSPLELKTESLDKLMKLPVSVRL